EELREQVSDALQRLAHWYGDHGEHESAIPYARQWLALDPLHEPAQRELMALYARSRQRAAALRQYAECERGLGEELGVLPSPETVELYEAIRAGRELSPQAPAGVVDLLEPSSSRRHHLPLQGTPFVGRRQELDELERLLAHSAEARLVTVVGPGGMGKTRLVLEAAARQLDRYPDGVWFVSLASVQSAGAIVPTVAQVLGVSFFGMDPPGQQLLRYLRGKRMLLVLDNLEHLLGGVDLLMEILRTAPEVQLLVTSRVRLNMREEQAFTLGGMDYPQLPAGAPVTDDVRRHGSVVLFVRSAQRARSAFKLGQAELPHVVRICQLAQGMPLAILLAAAWVPALTPAEIAAEMERSLDFLAADWRDEPERHHSMRAVFDATWGMLTEKERRVFARLSVFRGGFTREAAQAVTGADLRALISLVNKSLLQRGRGGRYEVHELLRQYAAGKLEEVPEEKKETLDLYADYYVEFLARKEMELWRGDRQEAWSEIDNIRAAWHWAMACRRVSDIHRPLHSLFRLYHGSGLFQEGEDICSEAVQALRSQGKETLDEDQAAALGLALLLQVHFAGYCDHADRREELVREGLSILGKLGVRREVALAYTLGDAVYSLADGEQLGDGEHRQRRHRGPL
ncbi:MAG: BTAD domain-containing putative transcriptional regulator, partial [Anaerolineae bacterium]